MNVFNASAWTPTNTTFHNEGGKHYPGSPQTYALTLCGMLFVACRGSLCEQSPAADRDERGPPAPKGPIAIQIKAMSDTGWASGRAD